MDVLSGSEIVLHGTVGADLFGDGFTARDIIVALAKLGPTADVTVRINSPGGFAVEGIASHNALAAHRGRVTALIEGICASAATTLAMGADEIVMSTGALMMAHDPASFTMGDVADHEKAIVSLDKLGESMADIYARKTKRPAAEIRDEMRGELWMTGAEAVERGYADRVDATPAIDPVAFDYRLFMRAPEPMRAMASARNWSAPKGAVRPSAASAVTPRQQESSMPNDQADQKSAAAPELAAATATARTDERTRAKAILTSGDAAGREELASYLAFDTEMAADAAVAVLAKAPKAALVGADAADNAAATALLLARADADAGRPIDGRSTALAGGAQPAPKPVTASANMLKLVGKGA